MTVVNPLIREQQKNWKIPGIVSSKKPTGLEYVPLRGLKGLRGVVLNYPYCTKPILGIRVTYAFDEDRSAPIPVLSFLPALDRQVDVNSLQRNP